MGSNAFPSLYQYLVIMLILLIAVTLLIQQKQIKRLEDAHNKLVESTVELGKNVIKWVMKIEKRKENEEKENGKY